jgi:transcriptional regulator with XRE-family HTH domain
MKRSDFLTGREPLIRSAADFGAALRAARSATGVSLVDAAAQLGIAKQTLANLETGQGGVGIDTALRAAAEFGVSLFAVPTAQRELVRRAVTGLRPSERQ